MIKRLHTQDGVTQDARDVADCSPACLGLEGKLIPSAHRRRAGGLLEGRPPPAAVSGLGSAVEPRGVPGP